MRADVQTMPGEVDRPELRRSSGTLFCVWLLATMSLWIFAFYEVPADGPDWVRRAQIACFGSTDSGLPNAAGWMVLVLSPLSLLGAMVLVFGREIRDLILQMATNRTGRVILLALIAAFISEALWATTRIQGRLERARAFAAESSSTLLPEGYPRMTDPAPEIDLLNQQGARVMLSTLRGKPVILSFVFAHCMSVCPTLVRTIKSTIEALPTNSVHALLITLDPWRDTPAALPSLAEEWGIAPPISLLSGEPEAVNRLLDDYRVPRQRDNKNGDVVHPALVYVISPRGELAYSFNNPSPQWLRDAVMRLTTSS